MQDHSGLGTGFEMLAAGGWWGGTIDGTIAGPQDCSRLTGGGGGGGGGGGELLDILS